METFCSKEYFEEKHDDFKKDTFEETRIMINGPNGATSIPVTIKSPEDFRLTDETEMIFWSEIQPTEDGKVWDLVAILKVNLPHGDGCQYAVADFDYDSAMLIDSERCDGLAEAWETFTTWREENLTGKKENLKHAKN